MMKDDLLKDFKIAMDNPDHFQMRALEMAEMSDEKKKVNFGVLAALVDHGSFFADDEQELVTNFLKGAMSVMEDDGIGYEKDNDPNH